MANFWEELMGNLGSAFGAQASGGGGGGVGGARKAVNNKPRANRGGKSFTQNNNKKMGDTMNGILGNLDKVRQSTMPREQEADPVQELMRRMSFEDALRQAEGLIGGGGGGTDYSAIENTLRKNTGEADSRLEAMYRQLRGSIDQDAPQIAATHDQAISGVNAATDAGVSNINNAYNSTREEQTRQLAALGIGDAAAVLAQNGNAAADQAGAVTGLETNRGANVNQLQSNKAAAQTYNTNIGNAAGLEGNLQRAALQQGLADKLAEISTAKSAERDNSRQDQISLAMQLMDRNNSAADSEREAIGEQQNAYQEYIMQQQQDAQKNASRQSSTQNKTYMALLKLYDGDAAKAEAMFKSMLESGRT